jgi:hypothetical protein
MLLQHFKLALLHANLQTHQMMPWCLSYARKLRRNRMALLHHISAVKRRLRIRQAQQHRRENNRASHPEWYITPLEASRQAKWSVERTKKTKTDKASPSPRNTKAYMLQAITSGDVIDGYGART